MNLNLVLPCSWLDIPHNPDRPPFWAVPWPCGTAMAARLLRDPELVAGKRVCDVGCGVGTAGIAAGMAGASHTTLLDLDPDALALSLIHI